MAKISPFRFKRFSVAHSRSSMKVGVDGVLVGCWASIEECGHILDVGTGCGLIALICAQRNPNAIIEAIDIDSESIEEANENFQSSPFPKQPKAILKDYLSLPDIPTYDAIVSNPPFFDSGVKEGESPRMIARHGIRLTIMELVIKASAILKENGILSIIVPPERLEEIKKASLENSLILSRLTQVRGHTQAPVKRLLLEFKKSTSLHSSSEDFLLDEISLMKVGHEPTEKYRNLTKEFYLFY